VQQQRSLAPTEDDAELVRAVARGERAAEAELYRRFAPRVRLYGLRHLRDPHAAADLVQQVLVMTLERLREGRLREPGKLASFVLGTSRMVVMDQRRGAARREALLETWAERDEAAPEVEPRVLEAERLAECLDALAERDRAVLVASFYADQSAEEAGRELGIAPGNVRVIRHRALGKLRGCMGLE
jgi:RNA polymerase sigma-70 factor (ECF subfamily)